MPGIRETDLPGIGRKFLIETRSGDKMVVVVHDDGRRALYHFDPEDPDEPVSVVTLEDGEARQLAAIVGGLAYQPKILEDVHMDINDLMIKWYKLDPHSPGAGKRIGDLRVRQATGATIIAIVGQDRSKKINPGPDEVLRAGQTIVVVGERGQVKALERRIVGEGR